MRVTDSDTIQVTYTECLHPTERIFSTEATAQVEKEEYGA